MDEKKQPPTVPMDELWDTYEVPQNSLFEGADTEDDGRVNIDPNSRLAKTVSLFMPSPPKYTPTDIAPPYQPPPQNTKHTWNTKLNIVIQVVGSRGDVQPFIALGNELQKYGHRVRLATHNVFEDFVVKCNLEFFPIGGDPAELMAFMVKNPGLIPNQKSIRAGEIQRKRAMIAEMLEGCWESCIRPDPRTGNPFVADAIIANPVGFAHVHCAQALGIPVHLMFTMPWSATRAFPHPLTNLKNPSTDPTFANYLSYGVIDFMTWQGIGDIVNKWRRETLELEAISPLEGPFLIETLKIPFTYCWSPALVPKPIDWPSHIDVCGFFFRDPPVYTPSPELKEFLESGPPPIYIGFGSIVIDDPEKMTAILLEAIRMTGVRAIISRGWSNLGGEEVPNVLYLGDCPHEWLFQHVVAVFHHGGAGTTACGLLHAKPTTIVPFFGDQPFWGTMVATAGAGPNPIPHKSLNSRNLAKAIRFCLTPEAQQAAEQISEKMRRESGVAAAVRSFHSNLPLESLQCDLIPDQPAAWIYKYGQNKFKVSKLAAAILSENLKSARKHLTLHQSKPIFIENRRWEPVTAISSAYVATAVDMTDAAVGVFSKPYKEYKRRQPKDHPSSSSQPESSSSSILESSSSQTQSINSNKRDNDILMSLDKLELENNMGGMARQSSSKTAGAMAKASAASLGNIIVMFYKGVIVDIPLAATDGLRAIPSLYNSEVADYGKVTDWKSGAEVAGKTFAHGMYEGLTDMFVEPYRGKKKEGAVGVAKGLGKGLVSLGVKTTSGALGLVAYPAQGICKSIRTAVKSGNRKRITEAKIVEGEWLMGSELGNRIDHRLFMAQFEDRQDF